jgi:hypothetical protein
MKAIGLFVVKPLSDSQHPVSQEISSGVVDVPGFSRNAEVI